MSRSIESTGQDIESAIAQGLADLGVTREQVTVEILEQPVRRMLNLGTRLARVRLTVTIEAAPAPVIPPPPAATTPVPPVSIVTPPPPPPVVPPVPEPPPAEPIKPSPPTPVPAAPAPPIPPIPSAPASAPAAPIVESVPITQRLQQERPAKGSPRPQRREMDEDDRATSEELGDVAVDPISPAHAEREAEVGVAVVQTMLSHMGLTVQVTARRANTERGEAKHWLIDVRGENLGMLVGTKGETVAALQYLARLIVSRQVGHHANLVIDVDGYKARREEMLKRLAQRMAKQAIEMKRTVSLEPMPPHERRIVHLTLRNHPDVTTESVGEGDKRKVTIVPRNK